jgi:hypothetical protein
LSLSNYSCQGVLTALFGKPGGVFGALTLPPAIHLALSTSLPNEAGGNITEPVGGNYSRISMPASAWTTPTLARPSVIANAGSFAFPVASASWGNIVACALFNAPTGGNCLASTQLAPRVVGAGGTITFAALGVEIRLGG